MTQIQDVLSELQQLTADAGQPLQNIPTAIKAGVEGKIRAAQAKLPAITAKYQALVAEKAVFIPVSGTAAQEFASKANEYFGAFAADFNKLPNEIYARIKARGYADRYSPNTHQALLTELGTIKGLLSLQKLSPLPYYSGSQNKDVHAIIVEQFDEFYEGQLNVLNIKRELGIYALANGFDGESLPVIIYGQKGTLYAKHLATLNELTINKNDETQEITQTDVQNVLKQLKRTKS